MPEASLIDGIDEFMRTLFPDYLIIRKKTDHFDLPNGPLHTLRPVVVVAVHGQECLRLVVEYHYVRLWRTYHAALGPRIKEFMVDYLNGSLSPDGKWWYETGGLGFDLQDPRSMGWLEKACRALVDDYLDTIRR